MAQFDAFDDGVTAAGPIVGSALAATSELSYSSVETEADCDQRPREGGERSHGSSWQ